SDLKHRMKSVDTDKHHAMETFPVRRELLTRSAADVEDAWGVVAGHVLGAEKIQQACIGDVISRPFVVEMRNLVVVDATHSISDRGCAFAFRMMETSMSEATIASISGQRFLTILSSISASACRSSKSPTGATEIGSMGTLATQ